MQKGQWNHFLITWDMQAEMLTMYINGQLVGHNYPAKAFNKVNDKLYIGNPLMVISKLSINSKILNNAEVIKEYQALRPGSNNISDKTIREIVTPKKETELNIELDDTWEKVYECSFKNKSDLEEWTFQTGDVFRDKFKLKTTNRGLYWETPDTIHTESRAYLWSPINVEGDQWIEFEFQLVSPKGLALLMICASGLQGEDIIEDHGLQNTGSMGDMLANYRNYHWEYMRRVDAMRIDVEIQYLNKNPWGKSLYVGCVPRFVQNRWYKIRFIKIGNRLYGSLDGKAVFDIMDNPYDNNGSLFNSGRVIMRQMYHTTMLYRNFVIYKKIE